MENMQHCIGARQRFDMNYNIDIENKKIIGKGAHCEVYKISDDKVLKLYHKDIPESEIIKEQKLAKAAMENGIQTAEVYDIYQCGDRKGLLFEYIHSCTLTEYLCRHPDEYEIYAKKLAELALQLHKMKIDPSICMNYKEIMHERLNAVKNYYRDDELKKIHRLIYSIPDKDTIIHTDFHPGNVMMRGKELILIDMADISIGHPIFDIASTYMGLVVIPRKFEKQKKVQSASLDVEAAEKMWDIFIREYLQNEDEGLVELYENCSKAITDLRFCASKNAGNTGGERIAKLMAWRARFTFLPKINKYCRLMSQINVL